MREEVEELIRLHRAYGATKVVEMLRRLEFIGN
jgi:hypothetical protein